MHFISRASGKFLCGRSLDLPEGSRKVSFSVLLGSAIKAPDEVRALSVDESSMRVGQDHAAEIHPVRQSLRGLDDCGRIGWSAKREARLQIVRERNGRDAGNAAGDQLQIEAEVRAAHGSEMNFGGESVRAFQ